MSILNNINNSENALKVEKSENDKVTFITAGEDFIEPEITREDIKVVERPKYAVDWEGFRNRLHQGYSALEPTALQKIINGFFSKIGSSYTLKRDYDRK